LLSGAITGTPATIDPVHQAEPLARADDPDLLNRKTEPITSAACGGQNNDAQ
jgi:hypothetical protein